VIDELPQEPQHACPECGQRALHLQYVVAPDKHTGFLSFWCSQCLHGIDVSRVKAPSSVDALPLSTSPEDIAKRIPRFVRVEA
jgi:hypothetical protein